MYASPASLQFLGDALRDRHRGHAPRLGATDLRLDPQSGFEAHLGNLGGLAGTRLPRDDHDLVRADRRDDVVLAGRDGQLRRIGRQRSMGRAQGPHLGGLAGLRQQPVEDGIVPVGVMVVAEQPNQTRAQPDPVPTQALRQQRFQFFNPGVIHPRAAHPARFPKLRGALRNHFFPGQNPETGATAGTGDRDRAC